MRKQRISLSFAAVSALAACQGASPDGVSPGAEEIAPSRVGPVEDLGDLADRAEYGFSATAEGLHAATSTHEALIDRGVVRMTPYDWQGATPVVGAPVEFATAAIRRGETAIDEAPRAGELQATGDVAIRRGEVTEIIANRDEGVEQSWRFDAAPVGDGDLVVAVGVTGHQTVAQSDRGLHFMTPGRLGFRYSNAMWVDASGTSWNIPISWDGTAVVMNVPASVLDASAYPAVLDPVISPQTGMDTQVNGFTGGQATQPAIAWSGDDYLVVWTDDRNGSARLPEIFAARVRSNGVLIDKAGIPVAHTTIQEDQPVVTWTGTQWLVAWTRSDNSGAGIAAATVATNGAVTSLGIVAGTFAFESVPALASDGAGGALLVYQSNQDINGQFFDGTSFGTEQVIAGTAAEESNATVAHSSGGTYLVAWEENATAPDIHARQLTSTAMDAPFTLSADTNAQTRPSAAFNGTNYVVAWRSRTDIWGARVSTAGAVLDTTGAVGGIAISATPTVQTDPSVSCDGTQCLIAWADLRDTSDPSHTTFGVYGQRVNLSMAPVGGEIAISDPLRSQGLPALAPRPGGFAAVWEDGRSGVDAIFSTLIAGNGGVLSPDGVLVSQGVKNAQNRAGYAIGATTHLAVWSDSRNFGDDIRGRRHDTNGVRLDTDSFAVGAAEWDQSWPAIDFNGTAFVSVWVDQKNPNADIYGTRITEAGNVSSPAGVPISTADGAQNFPDIASGAGGVSLAVWADRRNPDNGYDIMGAILAPSGSVSVADVPICQMAAEQEKPAVAWDPDNGVFVVVWSDRRTNDSADIFATIVQTDGTVVGPACGTLVSGALNWQTEPDIATSGSQLLVVWEDYRSDFFGDIFAGRITASGGVITRLDGNGMPVATGVSWQTQPTVVGVSQGRFGLAWTDTINELTAGTDIIGNTMQSTGELEPAYVTSGDVCYESQPQFQNGANTSNKAFIVYERARVDVNVRVRKRRLTY